MQGGDHDTSRAPHSTPPCPPNLLSVIDVLPLDVFDVHVWAVMSPETRRTLRLTCRQSKQLVDLLLTSAHLCLFLAEADSHKPEERDRWGQRDHEQPLPADRQTALRLAAEHAVLRRSMHQFARFVARLPRLNALVLKSWHSEADLISALVLCGAATGGRISRLHLGGQRLWAPTLQAVRDACPRLEELQLENCGPPGRERASLLLLRGEVFAPLSGIQLKRLDVGWDVDCSRDMMRSLGGLVTLEHLSMSVNRFDTADLFLLGGLRRLRTCSIGCLMSGATLVEAASLFHSTGLVSFQVDIQHPEPPAWGTQPEAKVAAALALLGGLVNLEVLDLGRNFLAGGAETAALLRCVRLKELTLGGMQAAAPAAGGGHLPDLHTLRVGSEDGLVMTPSLLLQALLPLRPLSSLTSLNGGHDVQINIGLHGADANGVAADLRQALLHLAAAPLLQLGGAGQCELVFCASLSDDTGWDLPLLGLPQLGDALLPWLGGGRLTRLHLAKVTMPLEGWGALQVRLPGLSHLHLDDCKVGRSALVAIAQEWTALRRLSLSTCNCPRERGWVSMAVVRAHPLLLDVDVAAETVARCNAMQEACFGERLMEWVWKAPPVVQGGAFVFEDGDEYESDMASSATRSDEGSGEEGSGEENGVVGE